MHASVPICLFLFSLQKITDYPEDENTIHVFAKCDDFMEALCKRLDITIPPFRLKRRAKVETKQDESGKVIVTVTGLDVDEDLPYSFIKVRLNSSFYSLVSWSRIVERLYFCIDFSTRSISIYCALVSLIV